MIFPPLKTKLQIRESPNLSDGPTSFDLDIIKLEYKRPSGLFGVRAGACIRQNTVYTDKEQLFRRKRQQKHAKYLKLRQKQSYWRYCLLTGFYANTKYYNIINTSAPTVELLLYSLLQCRKTGIIISPQLVNKFAIVLTNANCSPGVLVLLRTRHAQVLLPEKNAPTFLGSMFSSLFAE